MFMPIQEKKCDLGIEKDVIMHMASHMPEYIGLHYAYYLQSFNSYSFQLC